MVETEAFIAARHEHQARYHRAASWSLGLGFMLGLGALALGLPGLGLGSIALGGLVARFLQLVGG